MSDNNQRIRDAWLSNIQTEIEPADLIDPIGYEVMTDPVDTKEQPTTYFPRTNAVLSSDKLVPNTRLKAIADRYVSSRNQNEKDVPDAGPIKNKYTFDNLDSNHQNRFKMLNSDVFQDLDRVMALNLVAELKLRPAQLVVLGMESHGKSSLLERIITFPVFPRSAKLCTRCVIRVFLRRGEVTIPSIVMKDRRTGDINESTRVFTPIEGICSAVQKMMNDIMEKEPGCKITDKFEIIVEVQSPSCPNLIIVDLPGIVTANTDRMITQDVPKATRELAESIIQSEKENSIFLLVVSSTSSPNASVATDLVIKNDIEPKTLGVFTKLDMHHQDDDCEDNLDIYVAEGKAVLPTHGWLFSTSKLTQKNLQYGVNDLGRLVTLDKQEIEYMSVHHQKYPNKFYYAPELSGLPVIREKIQIMFESFLVKEWVPSLFNRLAAYFDEQWKYNWNLGFPITYHPDYVKHIRIVQTTIPTVFPGVAPSTSAATDTSSVNECKYPMQALEIAHENDLYEAITERVQEVNKNWEWMKYHTNSDIFLAYDKLKSFINCQQTEWESNPYSYDKSHLGMRMSLSVLNDYVDSLVNTLHGFSDHLPRALNDKMIDESTPATPEDTALISRITNLLWTIPGKLGLCKDSRVAKFSRFHSLMPAFERHVSTVIAKYSEDFKHRISQEFDALLTTPTESISTDRIRVGNNLTVRCEWTSKVHRIPDVIMDLYCEIVLGSMSNLTQGFVVVKDSLKENCYKKRLHFLKEMRKVIEVLHALRQLTLKIEKLTGSNW